MSLKTNKQAKPTTKEFSASAKSPANIALIKYWGQSNKELVLPNNDSISFNLSGAYTITTVTLDSSLTKDHITLAGKPVSSSFEQKTIKQLDLIRALAKNTTFCRFETQNCFPTGAGIASSASGMSALTVAAAKAYGLNLNQNELSILARRGSGSASRSIPDGFVKWHKGIDDKSSFAESIYPPKHWEIHDVVVVVANTEKMVSSQTGHHTATTSSLYTARLANIKNGVKAIEKALATKDFTLLGEISEAEALNMHAIMMTSIPPLMYWSPDTIRVMHQVHQLRKEGIECYFTIDAGANVHVLTLAETAKQVISFFEKQTYVTQVIDNVPCEGSRIL